MKTTKKYEDVEGATRVSLLLRLPRSLRGALLILPALACVALAAPETDAQKRPTRAPRTQAPPARANKPTTPARTSAKPPADRTITVKTEPRAVVWLDDVRRGVTDDAGQLVVKPVLPGAHALRVRARGFKEATQQLTASQRGTVQVRLAPTTDEAELAFQQAEEAAEKGAESRAQAAELYRRALKLRPKFPAAHVGLARMLLGLDEYDDALAEIGAARRDRPAYPEASAVEGRILREMSDYDAAVIAYRRAIREGRGFQPEAYTGLGLVLTDLGDTTGAVEAFRKAVSQLSDSEPALYQLLGAAYERQENWKAAVAAYEKYLELAPDGRLAPAIRSIIDQLRVQAAEQQ